MSQYDDEVPSILEFSEDIASAEAPSPLPVREYIGVIQAAEAGISKAKGKRMIKIVFFVSPDQYPADYVDGNPDGTNLSFYLGAEDNALARYRIRQFCEAVGAVASRTIDPAQWLGLEAKLHIVHEKYEGVDQARIKSVSSKD